MKLLTPFTFPKSGLRSINRIALAPLTNLQSNDDGTLGDDEYKWLTRRAKDGFGIIITCAAHVSKGGQGWAGELGIFDDNHMKGLTKLAKGIHDHHSLAIVQIFHGGARSPEDVTGLPPWSASAHEMKTGSKIIHVRQGTKEDFRLTIQSFVDAADRAHRAGFDGVELHGAHGYLLHQFMSTVTNTRTDEWGGNFEKRTKLTRTILNNIKAKVPSGFIEA